MAEIKNTFIQGKMNKDLDERILPNGQYRNAMNVEVSTSEGSNVGTVQNILGNDTIEQFIPSAGYKCVGSISNEKTNSLYWFVKGNTIDAVLEYSMEHGLSSVIIDTKAGTSEAVLKFPDKFESECPKNLSETIVKEAIEMSRVYPYIYLLEN